MIEPININKKTGFEDLSNNGHNVETQLIEFWKWMGSDLISNSLRGIFAEFIVGLDIGVIDDIRTEWAPFDLKYQGLCIEVKSSAYLQSWNQRSYSKIIFSIAPSSIWDSSTNQYISKKSRSSHFYVFSVLNNKNSKTIDPLKLEQWEFYIIPTYKLDKYLDNQKTISIGSLRKLEISKVKFGFIKECLDNFMITDRLNILSNFDKKM